MADEEATATVGRRWRLLGYGLLTAVGAYAADVAVTFDPGVVAYGYSDGYWTTKREWRSWDKPEYVEVYRKHPGARYYEYRHDRDPDMGWRDRYGARGTEEVLPQPARPAAVNAAGGDSIGDTAGA